jgi:hypothetical protein
LQRLIERFEAFHAEFNNNMPTAIGGVQRLNLRDATQRFEHAWSLSRRTAAVPASGCENGTRRKVSPVTYPARSVQVQGLWSGFLAANWRS